MRNSSKVCHVRCHVTRYATHCAAREKLQMPFFDDVIHQTMRATMCAGLRRTGAASRPGARRPPGMRAPRVRARPTRACGYVTRLRARTAPHSGRRGGGAWLEPPSWSRSAAAAAAAPPSSTSTATRSGGRGWRRLRAQMERRARGGRAARERRTIARVQKGKIEEVGRGGGAWEEGPPLNFPEMKERRGRRERRGWRGRRGRTPHWEWGVDEGGVERESGG